MPELPEVEVVRRGLAQWVNGRTIDRVDVLNERAVRRHVAGGKDLAARLRGRTIECVSRRGKYLWFVLDGRQECLVGHLGMSGQFLMLHADAADEKHLRIRFSFTDDGLQMRFVDQRTFGGIAFDELVKDDHDGRIPSSVGHVARDPLDPFFDDDDFIVRLRRKSSGIKRALLDQTLLSGVGNIYADEALWRTKLHWDRSASSLGPAAATSLLANVREVMNEALAKGGTSFDSLYVNVNGESGWFEQSLAAYGQEGEPCPRCGRLIIREPFMNRSSYRCPGCQRPPARR